jgi:hypothetical protein
MTGQSGSPSGIDTAPESMKAARFQATIDFVGTKTGVQELAACHDSMLVIYQTPDPP